MDSAEIRSLGARGARWLGFVGAYAAGQVVSMALSGDVRGQYARENRPPYAPPPQTYAIVWSGLNLLGGTSAWRVWEATNGGAPRKQALALWLAALGIRTAYTPLAFGGASPMGGAGGERRWLATADAAALAIVMAAYTDRAARVDRVAAALALPEVAWTTFATVLSYDVARRN